MPASSDAQAKKRGIKGYRVVRKGESTFLIAVVNKPGPRGGHTVALRGPITTPTAAPTKPRVTPAGKKVSRKRLIAAAKTRRAAQNGVG